ncbi:family 20 glycosylhydrolase [Catenovulum sp. SM1970]|uniref:family 20 glycosylhydrolase n=1 Tax=Marinifaba aquimaris TaxID=2741323 RepID=UPI001573AF96|nr:family 20 glycosylhydrolase [Marinifaba aquimaris]NTS76189.1 family 20 glycosylhydrolase [Marinifaba aquimaris]
MIYKLLIIVWVLLSTSVIAKTSVNSDLALMPWPQKITQTQKVLVVSSGVAIKLIGTQSNRLTAAAQRFKTKVNQPFLKQRTKAALTTIHIKLQSDKVDFVPSLKMDERYQIDLTADSNLINITAATDIGAMHALYTLAQLFGQPIVKNGQIQYRVAKVSIDDYPRFAWRGLLLDPARHFLPVDVIKRQIDGMASAKLNVFHWHLTDDQGWRIESLHYPKLHQLASDGDYYTQAQMRDVVQYAQDRGIRVIPEVDVPGHASSIAVAYPELIALVKDYPMQRHWGVHEPTLNPIDEKVFQFIDAIVGELASIFPDPYFHIGGDEVKPTQWNKNAVIQAFIAEHQLIDYKGMQAHFNQRVNALLQKHQKKMIGWDEIFHHDLPNDVVVQSWRGHDSMNLKAQKGGQSILSTGFYVDQAQPTSYHYRNDPIPKTEHINQQLNQGDTWQTWSFEMPRLRGAAVTGSFTIIKNKAGEQRGFIDFKGRSRKKLNVIEQIGAQTWFYVDTWMGVLNARVNLNQAKFDDEALVANGRYRILGTKAAGSDIAGSQLPKGEVLKPLTAKEQALILGGEATLWGENVIPSVIDLRLWPRTYAIAERLWSAQSLTNPEFMYQRLGAVAHWSIDFVGLQHDSQAQAGITKLFSEAYIEPIKTLSEAIEQAQYYHRHHAKSVSNEYHQAAPLNRFADTLAVESHSNRQLKLAIQQWLANPSDDLYQQIIQQLHHWQTNAENLQQAMQQSPELQSIQTIVDQVHYIANTGLTLMRAIKQGHALSSEQAEVIKANLHHAMQIEQEIVIVSAYSIELLLLAATGHDTTNLPVYF